MQQNRTGKREFHEQLRTPTNNPRNTDCRGHFRVQFTLIRLIQHKRGRQEVVA